VLCADSDEIARHVLSGRLDVGLAGAREIAGAARRRFEPLAHHRTYMVCRPGHPLAGRRDLSLADVLSYPLATVMPANRTPAPATVAFLGIVREVEAEVRRMGVGALPTCVRCIDTETWTYWTSLAATVIITHVIVGSSTQSARSD